MSGEPLRCPPQITQVPNCRIRCACAGSPGLHASMPPCLQQSPQVAGRRLRTSICMQAEPLFVVRTFVVCCLLVVGCTDGCTDGCRQSVGQGRYLPSRDSINAQHLMQRRGSTGEDKAPGLFLAARPGFTRWSHGPSRSERVMVCRCAGVQM